MRKPPMSTGRKWAWPIGLLGMTQAVRHDLSLLIEGIIGIPSIALLMYASGLIWTGQDNEWD